MKKSNLVIVFVLALVMTLFLTSCVSKKKKAEENTLKIPIEQVNQMCFVKGDRTLENKKVHWMFTSQISPAGPVRYDPVIVEDSLVLFTLFRLECAGIAKAKIDSDSLEDALYFQGKDKKMIKTDEVCVSYGNKGVVQYRMVNKKLYVKKFTVDEMVSAFPKNIRDTLSYLGIYILHE